MKLKERLFSNGIVGGSLVLLVTINIFFALNYFFHFAMARMLPVEQYGVLVALYSIVYIFAVFTESIQLVISRYSTNEKDPAKVKNLLKKSAKKALKISAGLFLVYLVGAIFLSVFLKIEYLLIALTGLIIFGSFLIPITRGIIQGKKRFNSLGLNMISESVFKLVFAVILVFVGWQVYGAIVATLIGTYASLVLSMFSLRDFLSKKENSVETPGIYAYTAPTFVVMVSLVLFYSLDVLIARVFFSPEIAGYYAILSMISKVIFFGTQPISKAMFPLSTESKEKNGPSSILKTSFFILFVLIAIALVIIYLVPGILIRIFAGRFIPSIESVLIYPAIATSLISLANLNLLHKLSFGKIRGTAYLLIFVVLEIALLSYFSSSLLQFSVAFVTSSAMFLWASIVLVRND